MDGNKYMARRRFYVPVSESKRHYGRRGDPRAVDFLFESDIKQDDKEEWVDGSRNPDVSE